jgi:4-amino-4-deoxy-L-arabinose transferase-like glycosyltransferase
MLVLHLATVVLLYALARRLRLGYVAAGLSTLLFVLSPLAVEYSRLVLIDNVALPWVLGAFLLALSPRRHLATVIGSAVCLAIAILCKITFAVFLPALLLALFVAGDKRNRRFLLTAFGVVLSLTTAMWALYALLKNEFFPGDDHVSLIGTLMWQLSGRVGSGSILDPNSNTRGLVEYWLNIDAWLLVTGAILTPLAFIRKQVRPLALAMLIGLAMLLRSGYLPYPYVIALLPLAALMIGNALQLVIIDPLKNVKAKKGWLTAARRTVAGAAAVLLLAASVLTIVPAWQPKLAGAMTADPDAGSRQAIAWVAANVSRDNRLVVDSVLWQDLYDAGFTDPRLVWLYKTETDPEVVKELGGWEGIDYLVLQGPTLRDNSPDEFPTAFKAIENGDIVAEFGQDDRKVVVVKVDRNKTKTPSGN